MASFHKSPDTTEVAVLYVHGDSQVEPEKGNTIAQVEKRLKCGHSFVRCPHLEDGGYDKVRIYAKGVGKLHTNTAQYNYPASVIALTPIVGEAAVVREGAPLNVKDLFGMVKYTTVWLAKDPERMKALPRNVKYRAFIKQAIEHEKTRNSEDKETSTSGSSKKSGSQSDPNVVHGTTIPSTIKNPTGVASEGTVQEDYAPSVRKPLVTSVEVPGMVTEPLVTPAGQGEFFYPIK